MPGVQMSKVLRKKFGAFGMLSPQDAVFADRQLGDHGVTL